LKYTARKREGKIGSSIAEKEERFCAYVQDANEAPWRIDFEAPIRLDAPASQQVQAVFDNGVYFEANDAVARLYGLVTGTEVIGRPLRDFTEQSNPSNVERIAEFVHNESCMNNLRRSNGDEVYIEQHRRALEDLPSSFGRTFADSRVRLAPREVEVCNLVKNGLTSKEIADLLNIALHTIEKHRRMARNKLDLANKGINLRT
jgi:DNA-binding CsgD family transcriptional regulator